MKEALKRLQAKRRNLNTVAKSIANDTVNKKIIPVVTRRVTRDGLNVDGNNFSKYVSNWVKKREKKGLQTNRKNFKYEGGMFGDFQILKTEIDKEDVVVTVGMKSNKQKAKVSGHSSREGVLIIAHSEEEDTNAKKDFYNRIGKFLFDDK